MRRSRSRPWAWRRGLQLNARGTALEKTPSTSVSRKGGDCRDDLMQHRECQRRRCKGCFAHAHSRSLVMLLPPSPLPLPLFSFSLLPTFSLSFSLHKLLNVVLNLSSFYYCDVVLLLLLLLHVFLLPLLFFLLTVLMIMMNCRTTGV